MARGAAYGDVDGDGDLDLLINNNHGSAVLLRNDANVAKNNWVRVRLEGVRSNRNGLGAIVRVESSSGRQWKMLSSGGSYCSQSELVLTFGLGKDTQIRSLEVEWPSGQRDRIATPPSGRTLVVLEGKGLR